MFEAMFTEARLLLQLCFTPKCHLLRACTTLFSHSAASLIKVVLLLLRNSVFIAVDLLAVFFRAIIASAFHLTERESEYHLHSSDDIILIIQNNRV